MVSRDVEAENLVQLMGYPTIAVSGEDRIICVNGNFEQLAHATSAQLNNQTLSAIPDGALQQNLQHLIQKVREVPGTIHSDQLEFSGHNCQIHCQAMGVENSTIAYFVICITPLEEGQ
jgi:nitrogen-specific signal transduction histidine kinase